MLAILRKARLKDKEMRILMLGLDNAGKTTIVKKIMNEDVNSVSPTLGFIIKTIDYEGLDKDLLCSYYFLHALLNVITTQISSLLTTMNKARYKLNIWDVGGQRTLRSYWRNYFEKTDTLIWVVDATDRFRLSDCRDELHGLLLEERLMGASLLVFANKTDIGNCLSVEEIEMGLKLNEITTHEWRILPCSAMTGQNLTEGLDWVVTDAKKRLFLY